jgi:hypothetical protein
VKKKTVSPATSVKDAKPKHKPKQVLSDICFPLEVHIGKDVFNSSKWSIIRTLMIKKRFVPKATFQF